MPHVFINDRKLGVEISTQNDGTESVNTDKKLSVGLWHHVAIVIDGGISSKTGWRYSEFDKVPAQGSGEKGPYIIHNQLKQYYSLNSGNTLVALKNPIGIPV